MALKIDSYTNDILQKISNKLEIDKDVVYLMVDYKFKKIKDVIELGKSAFTKIRFDYFLTMEWQDRKFVNFNLKYNDKYIQEKKQDNKKESKSDIGLLGTTKLF